VDVEWIIGERLFAEVTLNRAGVPQGTVYRLSDGGVFPFVWLHCAHAGTTSGRLWRRIVRVRFVDDLPYRCLATAEAGMT
jgi:hypothetical protein